MRHSVPEALHNQLSKDKLHARIALTAKCVDFLLNSRRTCAIDDDMMAYTARGVRAYKTL